eukprot:SM000077S21564  [mRNA]  locus=s77:225245:233805:- [translate_table: standard]
MGKSVCLDGSPPGYVFRSGNGTGANSWVFDIQGGAWCFTAGDCLNRSFTNLGSSLYGPPHILPIGIWGPTPDVNPDFYNWNAVFFPYCDGASFSGDVDQPVFENGTALYFRGHRILHAIIDDLLLNRGLAAADQVFVTGCSAGGLSVYLHCDEIVARMPPTATSKCLADAGAFVDMYPIQLSCEPKTVRCLEATLIPLVKTPLFVINALYDSWQINNILAPPAADPSYEILPLTCRKNLANCTSQQLALLQDLHDNILEATSYAVNSAANGAFLHACNYRHCGTAGSDWQSISIGGQV